MKTVAFMSSNICTEERLETRMFEELLKAAGWKTLRDIKKADVILVYTCAMSKQREDQSIKLIEKLQSKKRPQQKVLVCGCLPKINKERLKQVFNGCSYGPREIDKLRIALGINSDSGKFAYNEIKSNDQWYFCQRTMLRIFKRIRRFVKRNLKIEILPNFHLAELATTDDAFYISTSIGCLGKCSFCAIRRAKGAVQSKPVPQIIEEFELGRKKGYKRFFFCADDLGYYGFDLGTDLATLLENTLKKPGDFEINLREVNPHSLFYLLPKIKGLFATGKIKSIISSVQSGSNRILQLMRRDYTVEQYKHSIFQLRAAYPLLLIRSALMVGFPGETDDDFKSTLKLLDEIEFNMIDIFKYSNRPDTEASRMSKQISDSVKIKRAKILRKKSPPGMAK